METEFYETVEMSTYLVALIISDFACINSTAHPKISKNVSVSVCARPEFVGQLQLALNVSTKIIEFFESFYNIEYPLPKSDHVALPDFAAGAMENWGLITYRESALVYDQAKTSQNAEQYIVEVIFNSEIKNIMNLIFIFIVLISISSSFGIPENPVFSTSGIHRF